MKMPAAHSEIKEKLVPIAGSNPWTPRGWPCSVSMLADLEGNPVQLYNYDPFGKPNVVSEDKNALKFTSRDFDPDTQLQFNRARVYDPSLARWLTRDPLAQAPATPFFRVESLRSPQSLNRCSYAQNNPLGSRDPIGLFNPEVHAQITQEALWGRFPPDPYLLSVTIQANVDQDLSSTFLFGPPHFTDPKNKPLPGMLFPESRLC